MKINEEILIVDSKIESDETLSKLRRKFYNDCVYGKCVLCGEEGNFTKSHSIPKRNLKNESRIYNLSDTIEKNGFIHGVYNGTMSEFDVFSPPKSTGIFKNICSSCDNDNFKEYEKSGIEFKNITNKHMAEIALKSELEAEYSLRIIKYTLEKQLEMSQGSLNYPLFKDAYNINRKDIKVKRNDIKRAFENNNNTTTRYKLLLNKKIKTNCNIYVNTSITPFFDINGKLINDLYNLESEKEYVNLYFFIVPENNGLRCVIFTNCERKYNYGFDTNKNLLDTILKLLLFYSPKMYYGESTKNSLNFRNIKKVYNLYNIGEDVKNSNCDIPLSELRKLNKQKFLKAYNQLNKLQIVKY